MFAFIARCFAGESISRLVENLPAQLRLRKSTSDRSVVDFEPELTSQRRQLEHSPERRFQDPSEDEFLNKKWVHPYLQEMQNDPTVWYHPDLYRPMSPEPDSPRPYNIGTPENWPPPLVPGYIGKRRNSDEASDYSGPLISLPGAKERRASWLPEQNSLQGTLDLENFFLSEKNVEFPSSPISPTRQPICYEDLTALEEALLAQEANADISPSTNTPAQGSGSTQDSLAQEVMFPMVIDPDSPIIPASETPTSINSHRDSWPAQSSLPRSRSFAYPQVKTPARLPVLGDVRNNLLTVSFSSNSNAVGDTIGGDRMDVERPKTAPEADLVARGIRLYSPIHGPRAPRPSKPRRNQRHHRTLHGVEPVCKFRWSFFPHKAR